MVFMVGKPSGESNHFLGAIVRRALVQPSAGDPVEVSVVKPVGQKPVGGHGFQCARPVGQVWSKQLAASPVELLEPVVSKLGPDLTKPRGIVAVDRFGLFTSRRKAGQSMASSSNDNSETPENSNQAEDRNQATDRRQSDVEPGGDVARPTRTKATIMDLARYKVGQRVFWLVFRDDRKPEFERADPWMKKAHPWFLWRHKILPWIVPMKPPRMHPADTLHVLMLCSQRPKIEPFRITRVTRCENTGEFLYKCAKGTVMPEGLLFPTRKRAQREMTRVAKLFAAWTAGWGMEAEDSPANLDPGDSSDRKP